MTRCSMSNSLAVMVPPSYVATTALVSVDSGVFASSFLPHAASSDKDSTATMLTDSTFPTFLYFGNIL
ncbi:hypothetical protein D3C76_1414120 [compost metagenome]